MAARPTALIADDEPLLREELREQLAAAWPELDVIAEARNGREAIAMFDDHPPDVCFLDIQMPGLSGVDVAAHIGRRAHIVFVTAYDHYAVQAFGQAALDYLVKPVKQQRLEDTVGRLKQRLHGAQPAVNSDVLLQQLTSELQKLQRGSAAAPLRWIRAQAGRTLRLIDVGRVDYLRADSKYTVVAWRNDSGEPAEAVVRTPLKELAAQLDSDQFAQVHRSFVVNLQAIGHVVRHDDNESAEIHLKGRTEVVPVSRTYLHLFRQM